MAGLLGLLVSYLLVLVMDRVWPTPSWLRLLILIAGISLFAVFAPYWLHRWVWRQRRETQLARLIARRYPGLGDRLLGVIELQDQREREDTLSPRLREAAMRAVSTELESRSLDEALPPSSHRRWGMLAIILAASAMMAFALMPKAGSNAFLRWLFPLSKTERYTFTRLVNAPSRMVVPLGESFEVKLKLAKDSERKPTRASGSFKGQPEVVAELKDGAYRFVFPGQQSSGAIDFRAGDMRHAMRIEPRHRPAVKEAEAVVTPPAYLGLGERVVDCAVGVVSAVAGSKVRFVLRMDRELQSGAYGPAALISQDDDRGISTPFEGGLIIDGKEARSGEYEVGAVSCEVPFSWADKDGLEGAGAYRLRVDGAEDAAALCYIQGIERQKVMLPEESVDFELLAEDDFGVRVTGIEWTGEFTRPSAGKPAKGEMQLASGAAGVERLLESVAFSPAAFGIGPQKILLRAYAEDFFPGRARSYSEPLVLHVLSRDEHAQMLKNLFDRQIGDLEDLARRETGLLDENERLGQLSDDELSKDENRRKLEMQSSEEAESRRRVDEMASRMEQLTKDAARNGQIDKETLRKIVEAQGEMRELASRDIPKVEEKLSDARDASNSSGKCSKDLKDAVERQREALEKMREAIAKAKDANGSLEAGTFVSRLKKAAGEQSGIVDSLKEGFERMLGVSATRLDPADARKIEENSKQQADTASDLRWLQEDLAHYFARTKAEPIQVLMDAMKQSEIDSGLEGVRATLAKNHSFGAAEQAKKWGDQLNQWAGVLGDAMNGGSGGSCGKPDSENEDFEFMLRVMKMIQREQDLRAQTRVLEQMRRSMGSAPNTPRER
ncbi:MAG: hypothetical protein RIR37_500 [Verrucomicrobiota bacterium]